MVENIEEMIDWKKMKGRRWKAEDNTQIIPVKVQDKDQEVNGRGIL